MATTVTITDGKKFYKLGFTREVIDEMERNGFDFSAASQRQIGATFALVEGAFKAYHPEMTSDEIFELWGRLKKSGDEGNLYELLIEMFTEPLNVLADPSDDADEGNAVWKVNR